METWFADCFTKTGVQGSLPSGEVELMETRISTASVNLR